ncbi:MAG TPA: nodulation protein NfeD [Candidatus Dormibacteraeota bacterium]|jgi:membrane-bound serine protease (ClpP class)|nr:nodulation protein NfeD [Candidatus Dormibacteraeota bacterium]
MVRRAAIALLAAGLALGWALPAGAAPPRVERLRIEGIVNVFTADYVLAGIAQAERDGAGAVLITMDTPGGIDTSMRRIIQGIVSTPLPVILYVWPPGARAASAGLYISQAADVVAMAPGTNIGSAHPVLLSTGAGNAPAGSQQAIEDQKVLNDSVAYIQSLAALHHRNADWAAQAVRDSVNAPAELAVTLGVADLVSPDVGHLLTAVDGRSVAKHGATLVLRTAGAEVVARDMGFAAGLLHAIADPDIAYLLMLLAIAGIGFEIVHPGAILPGVVGVTSAVMALASFESLPVSYAGLTLMAFAIVLFVVDVRAPTHGVLTVGGIVALALGSFLFLDQGGIFLDEPSLPLAVLPALIMGGAALVLVRKALAARRRPPATGVERLVGVLGEARTEVGPEGGMVFVDGALWQASAARPIPPGQPVRVSGVRGLRLAVEPPG